MTYKRTGQEQLKARMNRLRIQADSLTKVLAVDAAWELRQFAPKSTGLLTTVLTKIDNVPGGYGVGPLDELGDPDQPAPRDTIKNFLKWYSAVPRGAKLDRAEAIKLTSSIAGPFQKRFAWWYLSGKQKQMLASARSVGRFGGDVSRPRYWFVQEKGEEKAGIVGQDYISKARFAFIDGGSRATIRRKMKEFLR